MNTAERVVTAMNHEEPDRVPIWTMIDNAEVLRKYAADAEHNDCVAPG